MPRELVIYYDGEEVVKPFDLNSFSYAKKELWDDKNVLNYRPNYHF